MIFWFLIVGLTARSVLSAIILPGEIERSLRSATLVAEIRVLEIETASNPKFMVGFRAKCQVVNILSVTDDGGLFPSVGDWIEIEGPGGELSDYGVYFSGLARPYVGQSYKAYLKRRESQTFQVTGFEKGLVPLHPRKLFSRNRTDGSNGDGTGPFLYWDASYIPIPYAISLPTFKNLPGFVKAIDQSFFTWREPQDTKLEFVGLGCSTQINNQNDGINTVIYVTDQWPLEASVIAITRNFYISNHSAKAGSILDSDILLNAVNHSFTTENEIGKHDVQNIVTHEIGHLIGLGHEISPIDTDAAMYAIASPNETKKRFLHPTDLIGLTDAYGGVGRKLYRGSSPCDVNSAKTSCLAVHEPCFSVPRMELVLYWFTFLFTILVGRKALRAKDAIASEVKQSHRGDSPLSASQ